MTIHPVKKNIVVNNFDFNYRKLYYYEQLFIGPTKLKWIWAYE
jgi:hypothetical protein